MLFGKWLGTVRAAALVAIFWAGMLVGVSFLATLAKFQAPSLTLPVALDVGQHTFHLFNHVEWMCWALMALFVLLNPASRTLPLFLTVVLAVLLGLQTFWWLPSMDMRIAYILQGVPPPHAQTEFHTLYFYTDILKVILLFWLGLL